MVHSPSFTLSRSRLAPNSFASLILLGASLSGVTSGCSTIRDITGLDVPEPQSKVSTGALTGAAVGGGLGLLVGSTGGNAGEGLLVGSLAGSAVGAGIGARLERGGDQSLQNKKRNLVEQEELIQDQNKSLQRLRKDSDDTEELFDTSKLGEDIGNSSGKRAQLRSPALASSDITLPSTKGTRNIGSEPTKAAVMQISGKNAPSRAPSSGTANQAYAKSTVSTKGKSGLVFLNKPSGIRKASPFQPDELGHSETASTSERAALTSAKAAKSEAIPASLKLTATKAEKIEKANEAVAEKKMDSPTENSKGASSLPSVAVTKEPVKAEVSSASETKVAALGPKEQNDCKDAIKEAERALQATSEADRLFYLRRAARLCPKEPTYHLELGKSYSSLGKNDDAKFEFRQAIDLDPNNQIARDELSIVENAGNISR